MSDEPFVISNLERTKMPEGCMMWSVPRNAAGTIWVRLYNFVCWVDNLDVTPTSVYIPWVKYDGMCNLRVVEIMPKGFKFSVQITDNNRRWGIPSVQFGWEAKYEPA